uniref:FYVE-type domain-containing protein n=1 Tax=Panagrellus redivivus TaxID=6233 RepID=A0A7E4UW71_PANRE
MADTAQSSASPGSEDNPIVVDVVDAPPVPEEDASLPSVSPIKEALTPEPDGSSPTPPSMEEYLNLKEELSAVKQLANRYENELSGERVHIKELQEEWTKKSAQVDERTRDYVIRHESLVDKQTAMTDKLKLVRDKMTREYTNVCNMFTQLEKDFVLTKRRYEELLGGTKEKAAQLRDQPIDLPQNIEQLQFMCLQLKEELIVERAAKEHLMSVSKDDIAIAQEQARAEMEDKMQLRAELTAQIEALNKDLNSSRATLNTIYGENREMRDLQNIQRQYQDQIDKLEAQLKTVVDERTIAYNAVAEWRNKCQKLQAELDTSETVQKDFVRLSQNLQIQLEKIRQAEQEVRWQFDEDVFNCNKCDTGFSSRVLKLHCNHCGKIFCSPCLSQSVPSGPNHRPAKVCDVCHTLLNRDSAPFFAKSGNQ